MSDLGIVIDCPLDEFKKATIHKNIGELISIKIGLTHAYYGLSYREKALMKYESVSIEDKMTERKKIYYVMQKIEDKIVYLDQRIKDLKLLS